MPHRLPSLTLRWLGVCGAMLVLAQSLPAQTRLNLPQLARTVTLAEAARQSLEAALASLSDSPPWGLPAGVEEPLVDSLPGELRAACPEIIEHWGTIAEGTARCVSGNLKIPKSSA